MERNMESHVGTSTLLSLKAMALVSWLHFGITSRVIGNLVMEEFGGAL